MAAIQLKELDQQHSQILIGISGIDTRMELKRETEEGRVSDQLRISSMTETNEKKTKSKYTVS